MDTPVTFDWKIRLPDVLGVLRRDYAGRFPQLASAALETLLERLRDDLPEDFLPALGQGWNPSDWRWWNAWTKTTA